MSWTKVQSVTDTQSATGIAYPSSVTAGNLLITCIGQGGDPTTATVSDSQGNTWAQIEPFYDATADQGLAWYWAVAGSTGANTVNFSGTSNGAFTSVILAEFSVSGGGTIALGAHAAQPASAPGTGANALTSSAITPGANGALVLGLVEDIVSAGFVTAGSGFTEADKTSDGSSASDIELEFLTQTTAASISATWTTLAGSDNFIAAVASFTVGGGGGGGTPGNTGEKFPTSGTSVSESPWLDNAWTSPGSVTADDGTYASVTASTFDNGDQTYVLKATGFDFSSIPAGATIDGVTVRIQAHADSTSVGIDLVQLLDTSGAKVGTNKSDTTQRITAADAVYTFGGSADQWGNALTLAWVQDPDFGVAIGGHAYTANSQIFIDYVTVEIDYTVPDTGLHASPTGLASASSLGSVTISVGGVDVSMTALGSAGALGTPSIHAAITAAVSAISSASAFGAASATPGNVNVAAAGLGSAGQFGSLVIVPGAVSRAVAALASEAALGAVTIQPGAITAGVSALASAAAIGAATGIPGNVGVPVSALASASSLGAITAVPGVVLIAVSGLASDSALGAPSASVVGGPQPQLVVVAAVSSASDLGALTALPGALTEPVSGIASAGAFGAPTTETGGTIIAVTGLDTAGAFGALSTEEQIDVLVAALTSAGAFGTPAVSVGPTTIEVGGLGSEAFFGSVSISGGAAPTFLPSILGGRFKK